MDIFAALASQLFYLNEEELAELEKLAPRISEHFELWKEKRKAAAEKRVEDASKPDIETLRRSFLE